MIGIILNSLSYNFCLTQNYNFFLFQIMTERVRKNLSLKLLKTQITGKKELKCINFKTKINN